MLFNTITDVIQFLIALACLHFAGAWAIRLRHWPMLVSVLAIAIYSVVFFFALRWKLFSAADLNLMSSIRTLLMAVIIGAIPWAERHSRSKRS